MDVRVGLVEVYDESCNVLFTIFPGHEVVHVDGPLFNGGVPGDAGVVCTSSVVHFLAAVGQLPHPLA